MNARKNISTLLGTAALVIGVLGVVPSGASAVGQAPTWKLDIYPAPTYFIPNGISQGNFPSYVIVATNVGGEASHGATTITTTLPAGLSPVGASGAGTFYRGGTEPGFSISSQCSISGQDVVCVNPATIRPNLAVYAQVRLKAQVGLPDPSTLTLTGKISGGGAPAVEVSRQQTISAAQPPFGLIDSTPTAVLSAPDGQTVTQAGAHPFQLTMNAVISGVRGSNGALKEAGGDFKDFRFDFPPGLIFNPGATPVLCTQAQLQTRDCPPASQVGTVNPYVIISSFGLNTAGLYNMKRPPGTGIMLGFFTGNFTFHTEGGVRAGDYGLYANTPDVTNTLSLTGLQIELWGDPSSPLYDNVRATYFGDACEGLDGCPVEQQDEAFITLPSACQSSMDIGASINSWQEPGVFVDNSHPFADANGTLTGVDGCAAVPFEPTLLARPTTNVADAPTGLEADLNIPQTQDITSLSSAHLRRAVVRLPEGIAINPSSANGLGTCSPGQIGIDPDTLVPDGDPVTCPDSSRIGSVEVDSPLADHTLPGSVFVATPFDNPFDSLLAIYVVIDDPNTGTLIKLPGHVEADPNTGQLVTTFDENPQLPFFHFRLHFFGGASAALRTPPSCGTYQTTSEMTPWSGNAPVATTPDVWEISRSPVGGPCAGSAATAPNSPSLDAGTVNPIANSYTPMVINLRRDDGSQNFSQVTLTPPPGLLGKLAGIPYCPDSALAEAAAKTGRQEEASPSCPDASRIGSVSVAAGAGPAPYWAKGNAYLTGPYKGAPLSIAIITPATAGPYDLGTVVVRTALHLDPETAQITAVSDQIPSILGGIPLDVRQALIRLDRPSFIRTGTSCDPFQFTGMLTSTVGQSAALASHYQLGECAGLAFKPKLALRLLGKTSRGGNPALSATLTMPDGANIAQAVVALPHSEFIDNSHFQTICTRVQFAAGRGHGEQCPAGSAYGFARATSPLLDKPLEGPAFLRSSDHQLPDLVMALRGQISIDVVGRVDSVKGGIRTSFEAVPDAPVSSFTLQMQGGKKGLFENSTNICRGINRASAEFTAQNGKVADLRPRLKNPKCGKAKAKHRHHRRASR